MTIEEIIAEDRRLEEAEGKATLALMKHRWHWTRDKEGNPDCVSLTTYARARGVSENTIWLYAHGYEIYEELRLQHKPISPGEARHRAKQSAERQLATEAVAEAAGTSFVRANVASVPEIRYALSVGQERATERGTSFEEEVKQAAREIVGMNREAQTRERREKAAHTMQFWNVSGELAKARTALRQAGNYAMDVVFDAEELRILLGELTGVEQALQQLRERLEGRGDEHGRRGALGVLRES